MSADETSYERRLNGLLFDAVNKTEEFDRHKIAKRIAPWRTLTSRTDRRGPLALASNTLFSTCGREASFSRSVGQVVRINVSRG